jgi:hypothetical protein
MTGPIARSPAQLSSNRSHCGFCVEARDTSPWSKMSVSHNTKICTIAAQERSDLARR